MKKFYVLLLILAVSGLLAIAKDVNVSGDWNFTVTTPQGERTSEVAFVQEGENLKVTMKNPRGEATGQGTVKGSDIEWTITRNTPRGEVTITYKGKIQDENTITGEVQMGNFGNASWKATRKAS